MGRAGFAAVVKALAPTQEILRRDVNATVMKPADFARKQAAGDGFVVGVIRETKIWLMGGDHDLAELAQDRPA
jgi:hypothetical protein